MLFFDVTNKFTIGTIKNDVLLQRPIACHEIAKRTYDFVMIYVGNRTINMTLVILFLVDKKTTFF